MALRRDSRPQERQLWCRRDKKWRWPVAKRLAGRATAESSGHVVRDQPDSTATRRLFATCSQSLRSPAVSEVFRKLVQLVLPVK